MDADFDVEQDDGLEAFLPNGFGKQSQLSNTSRSLNASRREVIPPYNGSDDFESNDNDKDDDNDDDDSDSDSDDDGDEDEFPVSHELVLKTHEKAVTTLTLDPSGGRLITGSNDCTLKLHDFTSMTPSTIRAFKSVEPTATKASTNVDTHPIHQALFNPLAPSTMLVITSLPQAQIMSRDGESRATFVKGDMYIRDMHKTKGHISEVLCGAWHPIRKDFCVTGSSDSTLRIWDINSPREQHDVIVHKSRSAGSAGRTRMTAVSWGTAPEGGSALLAGAGYDGSIALWGGDGPYNRPLAEVREAHVKETCTGGIDLSPDGRLLVTRGGDDTIKVWDTRKFTQPVNTAAHSSTSAQYPTSNIRFSPNGANIIVGSETGHLYVLNPATLKAELVTPVTPGSTLITTLWHEKLNQIVTGSANGETHILYNPDTSTGGAKMVMLKAPKRRHIDDDPNLTMDLSQGIPTESGQGPFASRHPTLGLTASGRSRDPRRPHIPQSTPFSKSAQDADHIKSSIPLSSMRDEDPREALLKYADKAKEDPLFTNAWAESQPKTVYAELSDEEDEAPDKKRSRR